MPHPIPYQGSKRLLAPAILRTIVGRRVHRLYEPFAGSAAVTLAAATADLAAHYVIADSLPALAALWSLIVCDPTGLAHSYAALWRAGCDDADATYQAVRDRFNCDADPALLLYLLARCAKSAPRFNRRGAFNQAPDRRRLGRDPARMQAALTRAHALLRGRTTVYCTDVAVTLEDASGDDLVYLDPPYQGISEGSDPRYHQGFDRHRLIALLDSLNRRGIPYLLSYDGRSGEHNYGAPLPVQLGLRRLELPAGRSAQATLNGRVAMTVEALYLSPTLAPCL